MLTFLDKILGSASKVQLLRALLPLRSPVSGREAMRLGRIRSNAGAQRALDELSALHVIELKQVGATHLYEINTAHHFYHALDQLFEAERTSVSVIRDEVAGSLQSGGCTDDVVAVFIFGSVARNEANAKSDLDLLVVTRNGKHNADVEKTIWSWAAPTLEQRLGVKVSPYVLSMAEVQRRHHEGDPLMQTIAQEGRVLIGRPAEDLFKTW